MRLGASTGCILLHQATMDLSKVGCSWRSHHTRCSISTWDARARCESAQLAFRRDDNPFHRLACMHAEADTIAQ